MTAHIGFQTHCVLLFQIYYWNNILNDTIMMDKHFFNFVVGEDLSRAFPLFLKCLRQFVTRVWEMICNTRPGNLPTLLIIIVILHEYETSVTLAT